jgi:hypothetical protein
MSGESGVSKAELAGREEALLAFPGSVLLEESGHNEGDGWGFDGMALTAMLNRRYATDAEPTVVADWFRTELSARGWRSALTKPNLHIYKRGSEVFALRLWGKPQRPPHDSSEDWEDADERYWYDVFLEDATPATWKQTPASLAPSDLRA